MTASASNRAAVLHAAGDLRIEPREVPEARAPRGPRQGRRRRGLRLRRRTTTRRAHRLVRRRGPDDPRPRVRRPGRGGRRGGDASRRRRPGNPRAGGARAACRECRAGRYNLCKDVPCSATPPMDGAFANFVAIHEDFAFALPDGVSDEAGALIDARRRHVGLPEGGRAAGDRVLVTGAWATACSSSSALSPSAPARSRSPTSTRPGSQWPSARARPARCAPTRRRSTSRWTPSSSARAIRPRSRRASRPAAGGHVVVVGMGPEEDAVLPLSLIQNRRTVADRDVPLRERLPDGDRARGRGQGRSRGDTRATSASTRRRGVARGAEDPASVKAMVMP